MQHPNFLPFRGILYNQTKVKDLSQVVTPPYDVIPPEMQEELYARSPNNFVRIDLAKEPGDLRYEAAQKTFKQWVTQKILVRDEKPAFYFHHQTFTLPDGSEVTRKGFFGTRRIEEFAEGGIKPHEKTLEGPKADRLKLTRAVSAQLSPVFSLYSDPGKKVDHLVHKLKSEKPFIDFKTVNGERHQLWRESNPVVCQFVNDLLGSQPVFIADGHHRYETALAYRDECLTANLSSDGSEPFNYVLMYFSNMNDEGLVILPIHRSLHNLDNFDLHEFVRALQKHFHVAALSTTSVEEIEARIKKEGEDSHAFGLLTRDPHTSYLVTIKKKAWQQSPVAATLSQSLVGLDVTVLHRLIFEEILRISPEAQARQENIIYWKDRNKAINETRKGSCDVTFLLNPTKIDGVERVATSGETMPQKSTYFYPKILSGLVIHSLV